MANALVYLTPPDDFEPAWLVDEKTGLDVPNPRAGELRELREIGLSIPTPTEITDETGKKYVMDVRRRCAIRQADKLGEPEKLVEGDAVFARARIIPGSRIVETDHPAVVALLVDECGFALCDPPKSEQTRTAKQSKEV